MPRRSTTNWSQPLTDQLPVILVRGFGGLSVEDEKRIAYQGFNDGTVYPHKRGENYVYEGMILRFMKSDMKYQDATNVVGYFASPVLEQPREIPPALKAFDPSFFSGGKVIIDVGMALRPLQFDAKDLRKTLWVFRYYDLDDRHFPMYGEALVRLIDFIRALCAAKGGTPPKVNIIAHSMGGLIVREAIQSTYPHARRTAKQGAGDDCINKIVTLGTPHKGISFQVLKRWMAVDASEELERFNPDDQRDARNAVGYLNFSKHFDARRVLTVVGTNYKSYGVQAASFLNRLFSAPGEFGMNYNRSDGLVKQAYAQLPGAYRTFVHKCHGGPDSLVTSREAFEIARRFFHGDTLVKLRFVNAKVFRGGDMFGKSEFFMGVTIKPRGVDFELFHQSVEAENCYGPFHDEEFDAGDGAPPSAKRDSDEAKIFPFIDDKGLMWEGFFDTSQIRQNASVRTQSIVFRLDLYVGERDLWGIGFSDNVVYRKQCYVRIEFGTTLRLFLHENEQFQRARQPEEGTPLEKSGDAWILKLGEAGVFLGEFTIEIELPA